MATQNSINTNIPIPVAQGGTGLTAFIIRAPLIGNAANAIANASGNSNGRPLVGSTGANPALAAIGSTAGSIGRTLGEASLNLDIANYAATTFTPQLVFGGAAVDMAGTFTGYYMVLTGIVFFTIDIILTAKGSSTGNAVVTVPVTASLTVHFDYGCYVSNTSFTTEVTGYLSTSTTNITLINKKSGPGTALTNANFTDTSVIRLSGSYLA